jgi:hypothetical protein
MLNPLGPLACQFARSSDALTDLLQMMTRGSKSSMTKASSSPDCRQFTGQIIAPRRAQAIRSSRKREDDCASQSTRSPRRTPRAASIRAARLTRSSNSGQVYRAEPSMTASLFG